MPAFVETGLPPYAHVWEQNSDTGTQRAEHSVLPPDSDTQVASLSPHALNILESPDDESDSLAGNETLSVDPAIVALPSGISSRESTLNTDALDDRFSRSNSMRLTLLARKYVQKSLSHEEHARLAISLEQVRAYLPKRSEEDFARLQEAREQLEQDRAEISSLLRQAGFNG